MSFKGNLSQPGQHSRKSRPTLLQSLVLASTIVVCPISYAEFVLPSGTNNTPLKTSVVDDDIRIPFDAQIISGSEEGVLLDASEHTLTIDSNNNFSNNAIFTTNEAAVQLNGTENTVIIGSGSGITNNASGFSALFITGKDATLTNNGTIDSKQWHAVHSAGGNAVTITNNGTLVASGGNNRPTLFIDKETNLTNTGTINGQTSSGIHVTDDFSITNSGTINTTGANGSAIFVSSKAVTGNINNSGDITATGNNNAIKYSSNVSGTLTNTGNITAQNYAALRLEAEFGTINNSGLIKSDVVRAVRVVSNTIGTINNLSGGVIQGANATSGVELQGNITALNNAGTIKSTGGSGIIVSGTTAGAITNQTGGLIEANFGFFNQATFTGSLVNSGTITGTSRAINIDANFNGDLTNNGTLNGDIAGIELSVAPGSATLTGTVTNNGNITANTSGVLITGTSSITNGFINNGNIQVPAGNAVAFSTATVFTKYTQNAGAVNGDVLLSGAGGNVFDMSGGTITGDVTGTAANANTMNLFGGTIDGNLVLQNAGDVVNIYSPTITVNITGAVGNTFNIMGSFSHSGGFTNATNINVQNGGYFTVNSAITGNNGTLVVDAGGTIVLNNTIAGGAAPVNNGTFIVNQGNPTFGGTFTNNSILQISDQAKLTVADLNLSATGRLTLDVTNAAQFGVVELTNGAATNLANGSIIELQLTGRGLLLDQDVLTIVDNTGGGALTDNAIVADNSATLDFTKTVTGGNDIQILVTRFPFQSIAQTVNAQAIGMSLDMIGNGIAINPDLALAISQVDILPTNIEVSKALESLVPQVDGGLLQISQDFSNRVFDVIGRRIDQTKSIPGILASISSGDDDVYYGVGTWAKVYGSRVTQNGRKGFDGYNASLSGLTLGIDKFVDPSFTFGGALSYSTADLDTKSFTQNELDLRNFQLTLYGSYEFEGPTYLDAYVGAGINQYKAKRNIVIGNFNRTAISTYNGWQYAGKVEGGYIFSWGKYQMTPIAAVGFSYLDLDSYTESGAGGLSLAVDNSDATEFTTTAGMRFSSIHEYVEAIYVPEMRLMVSYDWIGDRQETFANFVASPVSFRTVGAKPDQLTYNFGVGLTAHTFTDLDLVINYDLEFKDQYLAHNFFLKLKKTW